MTQKAPSKPIEGQPCKIKLTLLDEISLLRAENERLLANRVSQIAYTVDLQRIIEDLCAGRSIRPPKTSARYHFNLATMAQLKQNGMRDD